MEGFACPPLPRRPARLWLPLGLSLALHALPATVVVLFSRGEGAGDRRPVPVDLITLEEGDGRRSAANSAPAAVSDEPESRVAELPVVSDVPVPPAASDPAAVGREPLHGGGTAEGGSGAGGAGGAGVLRAPGAARNVVYVIDRSLSMGLSGALPVAKRELLDGIDALPAGTQFGVILYNRKAEPLSLDGSAGLLAATAANRAAVARVLEGTRADGNTDHLAALRRALTLGADVIFFVTDAADLTDEQVRNVTALNGGRAAIHTVELNKGDRGDETPLKALARLNGGTYRVVPVRR
jgi:hypothetical protein